MTKIMANNNIKIILSHSNFSLDINMEKHILKVSSIYNKNHPSKFLQDLKRKINMSIDDFKNITHLHVEHLRNDRYHLRLHIRDNKIIEKLKQESELNSDRRSYTLRFPVHTYLFMTPEQNDEKFQVIQNRNVNERVLKIRKLPKQHILDILNKILNCESKELEYVSVNSTHAFIGFKDKKEAQSTKNSFRKDGFEVTFSNSFLRFTKQEGLFNNWSSNIHKVSKNHKYKVNKSHQKQRNHPYVKSEMKVETKSQEELKQYATPLFNQSAVVRVPENFSPQMMNPAVMSLQSFPSYNQQPVMSLMPTSFYNAQFMNQQSIPIQQAPTYPAYPSYQQMSIPNYYASNNNLLNEFELLMIPKHKM